MGIANSRTLLSRRRLLAAAAGMLVIPSVARAAGSDSGQWLSYERQLKARLGDAGGGRFDPSFAQGLLAETNGFRQAQGAPVLRWDDDLAACARAHVADMVARRYFAHNSPEGFRHADRVSLLCRDLCAQSGENLARRDYPGQLTLPRHFEAMWEGSPSHRQNLINPAYDQAGYGVVMIGSAIFAAGVYADQAVRLGKALPLAVRSDAELAAAIDDATPRIQFVTLTAPFQKPTWTVASSDALPALGKGVWQLHPLRTSAANRYDVLPGPLFQIL